jgi:hypothetical protein
MNESNNHKHSIHRRDLLKGAAGLGLAAGAFGVPNIFGQSSVKKNSIQIENAKPGTRDWLITNHYFDPETWWRSPRIEGYCSELSVSAGDTKPTTRPRSGHGTDHKSLKEVRILI